MVTRARRVSAAIVGTLLGAQAIGKLVDMELYRAALGRFRALPDAFVSPAAFAWVAVEVGAAVLLLVAAVRGGRRALAAGAAAAVTDAVAYAALTIGTTIRGIEVLNCTCFGAFLPQRLSPFVLAQDVVMVAWTTWLFAGAIPRR